jgi:2-polyprenyl-3-methyl-5-hydroxy-6-metoxy-1,4-benzoquinol methylase
MSKEENEPGKPIPPLEFGPFSYLRASSGYERHWAVPQDPLDRSGTLLEWVGAGKRVLDVGCSTGYISRALVERGCCVTGIEVDPLAAEQARAYCEAVHVLDLNSPDWVANLPEREFDVVLLADVLEHLIDPGRVLCQVRSLLHTNGSLVISLPNVVHWNTRLRFLMGQFEYQAVGTLDHTHLRFFTKKTARELIESSGYRVVRFHPAVGGGRLGRARLLWQWLGYLLPGLFAYQLLFEVKKVDDR